MGKLKKEGAESETVNVEVTGSTEINQTEMTIEETFAALDALIDQLESGRGSLEDAFKNYEEGMKLVKSCNEKIEKIEKQILVLNGESMEEMNNEQYV